MWLCEGWIDDASAKKVISPYCDFRPEGEIPSLLVIHNISLPPGKFGGPYIHQLFMGTLDPKDDPSFDEIKHLRVSAHCLIRRDGEIVQYVPFNKRAWHAGISCYCGRDKCNDFSIGIELEGTDYEEFTEIQYIKLAEVTKLLIDKYPDIRNNITGHSDIAPGRKTDPGPYFYWEHYRQLLKE
ncbi:1,6-anhydro-N-acetylmuramyl-L-alanine amidase AmpD [Xenorhabdus poinarii G6]|uniref:1,6-anhydro-N-acetylmuramyl-L-alanine amidase AmpD n=1 Tax=Xenorhabdus poinarii G6 TaxID=1354304 RepID=A0A068QZI5_9GAMM|nr:1,6-anhydro-N-acetylmuramyl-L-alanine amidase AmpD [Xenorhabdus poinarii]CDG20353.1 1,6-anhydro-N-acetylmuramyl-L-alanine amidase AmpD [Xenorhabdus poinarii G6]